MALPRFREAKTAEDEVNLVRNAVPKSTQYKNKWAYGIFEGRQSQRLVKVPIVEVAGLFKTYDFHEVESLDTPLVEMSVLSGLLVLSINYWLTKFVQEVAKPSRDRYPPKTLCGMIGSWFWIFCNCLLGLIKLVYSLRCFCH